MTIPALGSVFTLECLGTAPGGTRFLDGRTMDATVGLTADSAASGTQWALTRRAQDVVTLKCMGDVEGARRFLGGSTDDDSISLKLHTFSPYSGTRWAIAEVGDGIVSLRCLRYIEGNRFLDGRTMDGSVGLAPDTGSAFSGTRWRVRVTGKLVMVFCLGDVGEKKRFLDGLTADRSVALADTTNIPFTGTRWHMIGNEAGFTLKCLGAGGGGPWFLDGDTVGGKVRLAPHTNAPYTGTHWQALDAGNGEVTLRCLGSVEGRRYLTGRTAEGSVALVWSAPPALTGTRWRILTPCVWSATLGAEQSEPITVRVGQLTGSNDPEDRPVINDTVAWGAPGLDLGANCRYGDDWYVFLSDVARDSAKDGLPARDTDTTARMNAHALGGHEAEGFNFFLPHTPTALQESWRYCRKCAVLFFRGNTDKGACAAGGSHEEAGFTFVVPTESSGVSGQREWRKCSKCQAMFFELYPDRGVCPAGGKHLAVVGGDRFVLPFEDFAQPRQSNWRFCRWCRALFFAGDPAFEGACVADGRAFKLDPVLKGTTYDPFTVASSICEPGQAETPTGAFSYDGRIYVFVWIANPRDKAHPKGSYLVSKENPSQPGAYHQEFLFSDYWKVTKGFWQVAPSVVKNADIPHLPSAEGDGVLLFGQGRETATTDAVHLAWMPIRTPTGGRRGVATDTIKYFSRPLHRRRLPPDTEWWSDSDKDAVPLFEMDPHYTSLSVAWLSGPQRWILLYSRANNDLKKRGYAPAASVVARFGMSPWNWLPEIEIFNPCREQAYGCYMHWPDFETIPSDILPDMDNTAGWSYGAHLLNRFTRWDESARMLSIYYLLSLHRPYQTQVMFTRIHVPP